MYRYLLALPIFIPSISMLAIQRVGILPRSFVGLTMLQTLLFIVELYIGGPLANACQPQNGKIRVQDVEAQIRGKLTDS